MSNILDDIFVLEEKQMATISKPRYIYPPRPAPAIPRDQTAGLPKFGYQAQFKYNDTRNVIMFMPDGTIELWNRHNEHHKQYNMPAFLKTELETLRDALGIAKDKFSVIDGGLLHNKHKAIKDTLVVWDILVLNNEYLVGTKYIERYQKILDAAKSLNHGDYKLLDLKIGIAATDHIFVPELLPSSEWDNMWKTVHTINSHFGFKEGVKGTGDPFIEGCIYKRPNGILERDFGKPENNTSWSIRCRVHTGRHRF